MENETKHTQYQTVMHKCGELHRKTISLTAALDGCVEALEMCLPSACQAMSPASPNYDNGKECGRCCTCKAKAALAAAREARN